MEKRPKACQSVGQGLAPEAETEVAAEVRIDLVAGQDLVVRWATQPSPALSGTRIKRRLNRQDIAGREGWLVGLLAEAPGGLGSG